MNDLSPTCESCRVEFTDTTPRVQYPFGLKTAADLCETCRNTQATRPVLATGRRGCRWQETWTDGVSLCLTCGNWDFDCV